MTHSLSVSVAWKIPHIQIYLSIKERCLKNYDLLNLNLLILFEFIDSIWMFLLYDCLLVINDTKLKWSFTASNRYYLAIKVWECVGYYSN